MGFTAQMDTLGLEKTLSGWEQTQLPYATARALTATGQRVKLATVAEMKKDFDRPTPFTLASVFLQPATKNKLVAEVRLKNTNQKGAPPSVWLQPNVDGGTRQAKRSELMLRAKGLLPSGMFYVPGYGADLNRYGNISAGQLIRVMSALEALPEMGYLANRSKRLGARANKQAGDYFVGKPAGGYLPLGVYQRMPDGKLKSILLFVKTPRYHKLLPFYDVAKTTFGTDFAGQFIIALRDALILSPTLGRAV